MSIHILPFVHIFYIITKSHKNEAYCTIFPVKMSFGAFDNVEEGHNLRRIRQNIGTNKNEREQNIPNL